MQPRAHVIDLALDQAAVVVLCRVVERIQLDEWSLNTKLLMQSARGGSECGLARSWVTTAGVGPQPTEMILGTGTLLQKDRAMCIEDEY